MGPAHGPQRNSARVRAGSAFAAGRRPEEPLQRLCRGHRPDRAAPKQHRDRLDHEFLHIRRIGRTGACARDHARRQCRDHPDRSNPVVQYLRGLPGAVYHRPDRLPRRCALARQGCRPGFHRAWPDAAGAAYSARHAGAGRECPRCPRLHERHHRRSHFMHPARRGRHLGGAFQRRQCVADHVTGLCAVRFALCGAGSGARSQSRQRHQSRVRRCPPRQSRQLPAAARQSLQSPDRRAGGRPLPASDHRAVAELAA